MDLEHFVTKPSIDQFLYIVIYVSWSRSVIYIVTVLLNRKGSGGTQVLCIYWDVFGTRWKLYFLEGIDSISTLNQWYSFI